MENHHKPLPSANAIPAWWQSSCEEVDTAVKKVKKGNVTCLALTPGGRNVYCIQYGARASGRMGAANFNSAVAAGKPEAFCNRGPGSGFPPVLMVLSGIHGHEVEGIVSSLSLLSIMETGYDASGMAQPALFEKLQRTNLILVPLANPDGRARMPTQGWIGIPSAEMTRWGQGTRKNGEPYGWPACKTVHPMRGDVGILGGYYDDAGINIMHDTWHNPMSGATRAILELAATEGPDLLLNLHSHEYPPCILPELYVPAYKKKDCLRFAGMLYEAVTGAGFIPGPLPRLSEDGETPHAPDSFNLNSMLYHTGCETCVLYESPHGCTGPGGSYTYRDLLHLHHLLFSTALAYLT